MYEDLGKTLITVTLSACALTSQISFGAESFLTWFNLRNSDESNIDWWLTYPLVLLVKIFTWFSVSLYRVQHNLNINGKSTGDFVFDVHWVDSLKAKLCAFMFQLFDVPAMLTEAPAKFHVRHAVQPCVSFKAEGHRAWIFGWRSKEEHEYDNYSGKYHNLIIAVVFELPLVILQIVLRWLGLEALRISMIVTFCLSLGTFVWRSRQLYLQLMHRRHFRAMLLRHTAIDLETAVEQGDEAVKELIADHIALQKHFHKPIPKKVEKRMREMGYGDRQ